MNETSFLASCLHTMMGTEKPLFTAEALVEFGVGEGLHRRQVVATKTRLLFCRKTPMGCETILMRLEEVEQITTGRRLSKHYVQFLGGGSRVLVIVDTPDKQQGLITSVQAYLSHQ